MKYFHFSVISFLIVLCSRFLVCDGVAGNETILVVGAAGFVGCHAAAGLVSRGWNVVAVDGFTVESNLMKRYRTWQLLIDMDIEVDRMNICAIEVKTLFQNNNVKHVVFLESETPCIEKVLVSWNEHIASLKQVFDVSSYRPTFVYVTHHSSSEKVVLATNRGEEGGLLVQITADTVYGPMDSSTEPLLQKSGISPIYMMDVINTIQLVVEHGWEYVKNTHIRTLQVALVSSATIEPVQHGKGNEHNLSWVHKVRDKQRIDDMHSSLLQSLIHQNEVNAKEKKELNVTVHLNATSEGEILGSLQWYKEVPALLMPCASECAATLHDCIVTGYDSVIPMTKSLTRECHVVLYTIGIHRNQSSLKTIQSKDTISTFCNLAFIHQNSPLSESAGQVHKGWTLVRVQGLDAFQSARKASRLPKLNPARFFAPNVQYAVYFDSSSSPTFHPSDVAAQMLSKDKMKRAGVLMFHHPTLMYYGPNSMRSAMEEAELAKTRSSMASRLEHQKVAYEIATKKALQGTKNTIMPTALFIIWDLHSRAAHEFRCEWYSEYLLWGDRDQVALFFILARASHALKSTNAALDEWIPLSKSPRPMHLRLLLGKNEKYPFFIKGEDDEKGYPVSSLHSG